MYAEEVARPSRRLATSGSFVFVAIDDEGHPTPIQAAGVGDPSPLEDDPSRG